MSGWELCGLAFLVLAAAAMAVVSWASDGEAEGYHDTDGGL